MSDIERFRALGIPVTTIPQTGGPRLRGAGVHGGSRWLTTDETVAAGLYDFGGVMFGWGSKGYLTYSGDGHSMIIAPPGAGKGVGFVLPNLITYPGSMVVIDPKGENAAMTAKHRREVLKQDVYILDPCGVTGLPSNSYNPLGWLEETSTLDFMEELRTFAAAVIESGYSKETFWTNCARALFVGLASYLAGHDPDNLNLNEIYRLTRLPFNEWMGLWQLMSQSTCPVPEMRQWIRDAGAWYLGQHPDHQRYHLGTVQEATNWMGNLGAARIMGKSDFEMRNLKRKPMTIYLCVHPTQLSTYRGWFRLLVSQSIMAVMHSTEPPRDARGQRNVPVLFMLDEFARAVGRLSVVDDALPQMRGYGGRFAFVLQTIGQLKELYPEGWTTFEETCGLRVFLQSRGETAEHVSKRLGQTTVTTPAAGGFSQAGRPLLFPQEISQLKPTDEVAFIESLAPMICNRITSHADQKFSNYLTPFDGSRRALPSGGSSRSLLQQIRDAKGQQSTEEQTSTRVPPPLSAQQKQEFSRFAGSSWDDGPPAPLPTRSADEREAALLSSLSRKCGKPVYRDSRGIFGYNDERGNFVEIS